jgi:hypothetical protein
MNHSIQDEAGPPLDLSFVLCFIALLLCIDNHYDFRRRKIDTTSCTAKQALVRKMAPHLAAVEELAPHLKGVSDPIVTQIAAEDPIKWYRKPNLRLMYLCLFACCMGIEMTSGFDSQLMNTLQYSNTWYKCIKPFP